MSAEDGEGIRATGGQVDGMLGLMFKSNRFLLSTDAMVGW